MALVYIQENTPVDVETYDKVNEVLAAHADPPEGMILHTASRTDAGMTIIDVWESEEAVQRFREDRLIPALRQVLGHDPEGNPQVRVLEVHDLVKP